MPSPTEDSDSTGPGVDDFPPAEPMAGGEGSSDGDDAQRSLLEDLEYLIADLRTWLDAELSFQKSRAALVSNRIKTILAAVAVAGLLAVLALIGLTVGLIIALTPLITAWGATAVVVLLLLLIAYLLIRRAARAWRDIQAATGSSEETGNEEL